MRPFEKRKDCSFVENLIRLPNLKRLSPEESPFPKFEDEIFNGSMLSNVLKKNLIEQRQILRNEFYKYDHDPNFQFYFPESKFPPVPKSQQNLISYEKQKFVEQENTYRDKLSGEQIDEIKQKGQFKVRSSRQWVKIPYVWKLNDIIFKGINRVKQDWNDRCSLIYSFATVTWLMITEQFPQKLIQIIKFPYQLLTLLFGKKSVKVCYPVDYNREIAKNFWNDVMSEYYSQSKEWFSQIWGFFDSKLSAQIYLSLQLQNDKSLEMQQWLTKKSNQYEKRKQIQNDKMTAINNISQKFDQNWQKIGKKVFAEVSQSIQRKYAKNESKKEQKQKQILQIFAQEQFNRYTGYLSQELPKANFPAQVIEAILTLLTLVNITMKREKEFEDQKSKEKQKIQNLIREKNPILSSNYSWYQNKVNQEFQLVENQLITEFYNSFVAQKLPKNLTQRQIQAFKLWLEYKRNYEIKIQQQKQLKQDLYEPQRVFYSTYSLLPPFQVKKHKVTQGSSDYVTYEMIKSRRTSISTGRWCWKFSLYCMRLKTWTINFFVVLVYSFWKGPLGLRCLCGVDSFSYDHDVDATTGQMIDSMRKTVLHQFVDVLQGISQSREYFESLPDTGLFGKTCSRLCNLIECYLFRFLFVGIIGILTLYPIAIILFSLISLILILTIWIWVPLALLITYLFNIFIFQFETHCVDLQCVVKVAPFIVLVFKLMFSFIKAVFYVVAFFILTPLVSIAIFIYACFCFCVRSFGDSLILCFIRCCGHTPNIDSFFATKISGPDMAVRYFMSLNEDDVYILVQAQIQKIHLQLVQQLTKQKISQPFEYFKNTLKLIIEPLLNKNQSQNSEYSNNLILSDEENNPIQKNSQLLLKKFNEELQQYKKRYPLRPSFVRFTEEQLNLYLESTQQIVQTYVNRNKLNNWIFDHFHLSDEDYEELNKKIWIELFQCAQAIFQPLQSIDQTFKLQDQYNDQRYGVDYNKMNQSVNLVANAIKGQANLMGKKVVKFAPKNPNLFSRKLDVAKTNTIFGFMNSNSDQNISFNQEHPTFILFPHLSIKQLTQFEEKQYIIEKEKNRQDWEKW